MHERNESFVCSVISVFEKKELCVSAFEKEKGRGSPMLITSEYVKRAGEGLISIYENISQWQRNRGIS